MNTDLTFITNEPDRNLLDRFKVLIKDTELFDVLVGYLFTSGFYALYMFLEKTDKIRILIGIGTNRQTVDLVRQAKSSEHLIFQSSHEEVKEQFSTEVVIFMQHFPMFQAFDSQKAPIIECIQKILTTPNSPDVPPHAGGDRDCGGEG